LTIIRCVFTNNTGYAAAIENYGGPTNCEFCGTLILIDSDVVSNTAPSGNIIGAIVNQSTGTGNGIVNAKMTIRDSRIIGNSAGGFGAILNFDGSLVMSNTVVVGNSATDDIDGALGNRISGILTNKSAGAMELTSCLFSNNYARRGAGAIYNAGNPSKILNCVFVNNANSGGDGGAVYSGSGSLLVSNCSFVANRAIGHGAGIANGGQLDIFNSTFSGNLCDLSGSAIMNAGVATLTSSTVSSNYAISGPSGGIRSDGVLFVTNCTITLNGGAIVGYGIALFRNSIIAGNGTDIGGYFVSGGFNLIGNGDGSGLTNGVNNDQVGTAAVPLDPKLGPLQDNGGSTWTHALRFDSPAIDAGHSSGLTTDQRGFPRPIDDPATPNASGGDGSDIGAYEADPHLRLTAIARSGNDILLNFPTVFGRSYQIDGKNNLSGSWTMVTNNIPGSGGIMQAVETGGANQPRRFYRAAQQ